MKTQKQNEPQLSAEMEKRFDEDFTVAEIWGMPLPNYNGRKIIYEHEVINAIKEHNKKVKHFLATALEEQRDKMVESVEAYIDAIYPLNRFIDSSTGVVTRGVQEPTHVRMMRVEDAQTFNALEHVLAILTKKEQ